VALGNHPRKRWATKKMKCWICGQPADSREHKVKKSVVEKTYKDFFDNGTVLHLRDGKFTKLQGPDSKKIKYEKTICAYCNNNRTQQFDEAYEQFFNYVQDQSLLISEKRMIDFKDIYGHNFEAGQLNLFKYFVKLFGCDLRSVDHPVPEDLPILLGKTQFKTALKITFAVNTRKLGHADTNSFGMGINSLVVNQVSRTDTTPIGYKWSVFFSFINIFFWYNFNPDGPHGRPWIADNRYVYLGSFEEAPLV
jgi:hypothetical protein